MTSFKDILSPAYELRYGIRYCMLSETKSNAVWYSLSSNETAVYHLVKSYMDKTYLVLKE